MASSDTCFDSAFLRLESLKSENKPLFDIYKYRWNILSNQLRNLRTFHLFARRWGNDYADDYENDAASLGALLVEIEGAVSTIPPDMHRFCVNWQFQFPKINIRSFEEEINRWYVKFSDCSSQSTSFCSSGDLVEFIDSILSTLNYEDFKYRTLGSLLEALEEELKFFKNFIHLFTALRGGVTAAADDDDGHFGQNLLTHIKAMAVGAAYHSYMFSFALAHDKDKITEMQFKISKLLRTIKPVDPHVSQIYIQSLNGLKLSSRQPRSVVTLEILQDFITSLLSYLIEILRAVKIPPFSNKHQLQIFYQGLRSLRAILEKQPKNFDEKMRDLTEDVVYDTGVVVFSLFRDAAIEVGFAQEMDRLLYDLLEKIKLIKAKVAEISPEEEGSSLFSFPKVGELDFFDFLLENLTERISCEEEAGTSVAIPKHQIQTIYEELVFLRSFLGKIVQLRDDKEELQVLWSSVVELACRVEFLIDCSMIGDIPDESSSQMTFDSITQEINILKLDTLKISDKEDLDVTKTSNDLLPLEISVPTIKDEIIRLDGVATSIMNRLKSPVKELQVVPIVGMPGLGKTTLAKLVYNDSSIMDHFHIRAWCCISQVHDEKNLLLQILNCISSDLSDKCEEDLAELLRQNLLRKKFLIVLDNMGNIDTWNILKDSFPDNKNGSIIILTSRFRDVAPKERVDGKPYFLRHLSDDESRKLLKSKLFSRGDWPLDLVELRTQIVERCKGLPLTIAILAGILSTFKQDEWGDVVEHCLSSRFAPILEQCNNTLEVSYRFLPDELKLCLLYFGAFPEDREHSVDELTWLWIAEGFVRKEKSKSLEDEAKGYLMHLISRSLVMVDKQSSTGEVKTCRIHDLLHAFCVKKAKKESFFQLLKGYDELSNFNETQNVSRLWISSKIEHLNKSKLCYPRLRSLFINIGHPADDGPNLLSYMNLSKLLRVLDMSQIFLGYSFPDELTLMVHLRYLAVRGAFEYIPSSIGNLSNLETLIVVAFIKIKLPREFWKLKKLRHLEATDALFIFRSEDLSNTVELLNLETFSTLYLCWEDWEMILKKFPNIRKLKVKLLEYGESEGNNRVLVLDFLNRLESLEISVDTEVDERYRYFHFNWIDICFPVNLRKLILQGFWLPWCKISAIGKLRNLEVLKLLPYAFVGENWNMEEAEQFPKLRFLKLVGLDIVRWSTSESMRDQFPCLVKLVLKDCYWLEEVPSCLGDIPNLEMIEVVRCSKSAASSVEKVYENQEDMGKEDLKVLINQCDRN